MQRRSLASLAVTFLVIGAAISYGWVTVTQRNTSVTTQQVEPKLLYLEVVGELYSAVEITDLLVIPTLGYSHFVNNSITYLGVEFQTVCPSSVIGCPGSTITTATNPADNGVFIKVSITFVGGPEETLTESIGGLGYAPVVSSHVHPSAGILVEYIAKIHSYRAFLLVTPYSIPS
ncbi:MAG: hypothetical protein ABSB26_00670 [Nitrososphaerales archaeon]